MPTPKSISAIKLAPVYDVSNYGHDVFIPITDVLTEDTITFSTATITQSTDSGNFPIEHGDLVISNTDTGILLNEGDDTIFNRIYSWTPDMDARIYKTSVGIAFCNNVSAITAGTFTLVSVRIIMRERNKGNQELYDSGEIATGAAGQTTVSTTIFILTAEISRQIDVHSGSPVDIQIIMNVTTGTGTRQEGIIPFYPFQAVAQPKIFKVSGITFHVHATTSHADPIFKDNLNKLVVPWI